MLFRSNRHIIVTAVQLKSVSPDDCLLNIGLPEGNDVNPFASSTKVPSKKESAEISAGWLKLPTIVNIVIFAKRTLSVARVRVGVQPQRSSMRVEGCIVAQFIYCQQRSVLVAFKKIFASRVGNRTSLSVTKRQR